MVGVEFHEAGQQQVAVVAGQVKANADFAGYFEVVKIAETHRRRGGKRGK